MAGPSAGIIETRLVEHLWVAVIITDADGRIVVWNPRAEELYGWSAAEVVGQPVTEVTVHPDDADVGAAAWARIAAGQPWEGTFRARHKSGYAFAAFVRDVPLLDELGGLIGLLRLSADAAEPPLGAPAGAAQVRDAGRLAASRLARLQAITTSLSGAATVEEVGDVLLGELLSELGARSATLWRVDESAGSLWLARHAGLPEGVADHFAMISLDSDLPGPQVARTLLPVFLSSREDRDRRWPALAGTATGAEAVAIMPLSTGGRALGCLAFGFPDTRDFPPDEAAYLLAVADQCAIAIDRARLLDAERQARERLTVVADAAALLASSLDRWEIVDRLTALTVPRLADGCAVYVPDGPVLNRVALAHATAGDMAEFRDKFPVRIDSESPTAVAYRTGTVREVRNLTDDLIGETSTDTSFLEAVKSLAVRSGLAVPLRARGRVVGVMTLGFTDSGRMYDAALRAILEDVAARAAMAIDNSLLYEHQHRIAEALQRAIIPGQLPELPDHEIVGRYVPSGDIGFLGGDWWDAFPLPGDRLALIIGDVAGHDAHAASAMAVVRNALRAYAFEAQGPGEALTRLNRLLLGRRWEPLASALYAQYHPATGQIEWASAGHPAPVLVGPDGRAALLEPITQPVLAVVPHEYRQTTAELPKGGALLLYSDGLVEGRQHGIETGQRRLIELLADIAGQRVETVCRLLLECLVGDDNEDDVSILALGRDS